MEGLYFSPRSFGSSSFMQYKCHRQMSSVMNNYYCEINKHERYSMSSGDISRILDNLFLGSAKAARSLDLLTSNGITHVVNIAGRQYFPGQFIYKRVHFEDVEEFDEVEKLRDIFLWVDAVTANTKSKVLVQCLGGISRSASVVIGYLVWSKKFELDEAVAFVKSRRPQVRPRQLGAIKKIEMETFNETNSNNSEE